MDVNTFPVDMAQKTRKDVSTQGPSVTDKEPRACKPNHGVKTTISLVGSSMSVNDPADIEGNDSDDVQIYMSCRKVSKSPVINLLSGSGLRRQ
jgi:hypothetical protein